MHVKITLFLLYRKNKGGIYMKKNGENKKRREFNAGSIFGKIMAAMLIILMLAGTCMTVIYALI